MAEKRRSVGRPPTRTPQAKKAKTTAASVKKEREATPQATPVVETPNEEAERTTPLPNKIIESKPLPTLPELQPVILTDDLYQSIAASAVLVSSLERSRQRWVAEGIFERYWIKPPTKKEARPPPPDNPDKKWMKEVGQCTITVEPLAFEATAYVVKEPGVQTAVVYSQAPPLPPQQQQQQRPPPYNQQPGILPAAPSPYGTPYRPQGPQPHYQSPAQGPSTYYQSRTLPPVSQRPASNNPHANAPDDRTLPPINPPQVPNGRNTLPPPPPPPAPSTPAPSTAKPSPDPVIQMLATRASTDHELKALMKIVATGNANQDQLKVFQRHIDELTALIQARKTAENANPPPQNGMGGPPLPRPAPSSNASTPNRSYGSPMPPGPPPPPPQAPYAHPPGRAPIYPQQTAPPQPAPRPAQYNQPVPPPPPPQRLQAHPSLPIALEFHGPSASSDRFLFPAHTILEFLSPCSLLASFLVIRHGRDAVDKEGLDPDTQYYQPITVRVSVEERFRDVLEHIRRSVKPAEEVRTWMREKMKSCTRAEQRFLPLRLPWKNGIEGEEEEEEEEEGAVEVAPVVETTAKEKGKRKSVVKREEEETPAQTEGEGAAVAEKRPGRKKSVRISEATAMME
ncbi:hypothetical protein H2203_003619 [Taxawa tesnikishii (nom. ined.)]|nr:hypothetical protein H2203_003619 [Dothideales sp. JES 119]